MLGDLYRSGFDITDNAEDADVIVVNTCGFIEDAKSESLEVRVPMERGTNILGEMRVLPCTKHTFSHTLHVPITY